MAASSFRMLLASAGRSVTPPVDADTLIMNVPVMTWNSSTKGYLSKPASIPASSTSWYLASKAFNTTIIELFICTNNGVYCTLNTGVSITSNAGTSTPGVSSVDANNFLLTYVNPNVGSSAAISAQYITNSGGTLSATVGETTAVFSSGALNVSLACVLDSGNALVFGGSATTSRNLLSLINPTTLGAIQANTSATTVAATNVNSIQMFALSPTLAVISWNDNTNMKLSTVDIVSGTSFTLNSAFNPSLAAATCMLGMKINSTTALFAYYKTTNTIAVRTATIGAGGSVTMNTEYTTTATNIDTSNGVNSIVNYGSFYMVTFGQIIGGGAGNNNTIGISFSLSGNVVTFDTSGQQTLVTGAQFQQGSNNIDLAITLDSTHIAFCSFSGGARVTSSLNGVIQPNHSIATWSTFSGTNSGIVALSSGALNVSISPNSCWLGTQRLITSAYVSAGNLKYYGAQLYAGNEAKVDYNSSATDSTISLAVASNALLSYDISDANGRMLTIYYDGSTVTTQVVSFNANLGKVLNTPSTFTPGSTTLAVATTGLYNLIPLDGNNALFINANLTTAPTAYRGNIITTNTGLNTINTTNTNSSILTISGQTFGVGSQFMQYAVIDSTHIAILFQAKTTVGGLYDLKMCILSISGTTVTANTVVTVVSGYTNTMQSFGINVFTGSNSGIVFYTNDASPGTSLLANGFTYSGTTITLGSQNTLATSQHIANKSNGNGNPSMVTVSPTEAICLFYDSTAAQATMRLLTYVNVNSITAGSAIQGGATTTNAYLIAADNYNDTFTLYTDNGYTQYYRG